MGQSAFKVNSQTLVLLIKDDVGFLVLDSLGCLLCDDLPLLDSFHLKCLSVLLKLKDAILLLHSDLLVEKSFLLQVLVTCFNNVSEILRFNQASLKGFNFHSLVLGDTGLIVERGAGGLKSLDFDILILVFDLLTVDLLNYTNLGKSVHLEVAVITTSIHWINVALSVTHVSRWSKS